MKSKTQKIAKLLIQLLPQEGTYQLMTLAAAESKLQISKEKALGKLYLMSDDPSPEQVSAWWADMRDLLYNYMDLVEVIQSVCAVLGPTADKKIQASQITFARSTDSLKDIQDKLEKGELFLVIGPKEIN